MDSDTSPNPFASSPASSPSPLPSLPPPVPRKPSSLISAASGSPPPTHRASFPDPSRHPKMGATVPGPRPKTDFCCSIDKDISAGEQVHIVDALKTTEGGTASYITYVIRLGTHTVRRRYSAFLSLHQALTGLYPVLIIPPIPSKQSLTDYAVKGQSKAREDATIIARRKRLLEDFLKRLIRHPILGGEHVLHRFLEEDVSWSEVLHSPPISLLSKNPLHAPSHNPTFQPTSPTSPSEAPATMSYIAHHLLPTPSPSHPLRQPDQRFMDSEAFTEKFQSHFSGTMEKVNRRVTKRWGERAHDMSELGGIWNGFSLLEQGKLGEAIEKVGRAVDADYLATAALLQSWEKTTTEPLHIYSQFATLIRARLSFRHQKHVQYELVQEALETQRDKLEILENAEREAKRLEEALERGGNVLTGPQVEPVPARDEQERAQRRARATQGFGLLSAVKHSLSGMIDMDPEATRRANIAKTRDNISQLEDSYQAAAQDLKYASMTLQADLDRFQRQKVADLREMAINLSQVHRDWCKQNLEAWKAAQAAVREIDLHPNRPPQTQPQSEQSHAGPSSTALHPHPQTEEDVSKLDDIDAMKNEIERMEIADKPLPKQPSLTGTGGDGVVSSPPQPGQGSDIEEHEGDGPLGPL
ncbi:sorting nexin-41 [Cryptococcus deuterogattii 99/473]|uniref:Sorting nexin-41 n=1 Tax=Cryptococcus deuterogattii Ram5 TaxID=1296110 RepID=A0A0D0VF68_9TREE|nr:sorting nexin-41 [Cryptococcus deuterogattii LA55]KIR43500.1 sorting nexin-41 [Cryptococcus deuterogattii Ram5]KIR92240.1 sorting nexin-41 [Cryptococcus deuterogattii CBS 10090]KIY57084.1 sorting nexin-41 [Cryptococcus deuterogattii 99/473]